MRREGFAIWSVCRTEASNLICVKYVKRCLGLFVLLSSSVLERAMEIETLTNLFWYESKLWRCTKPDKVIGLHGWRQIELVWHERVNFTIYFLWIKYLFSRKLLWGGVAFLQYMCDIFSLKQYCTPLHCLLALRCWHCLKEGKPTSF